jgi:hypothetical protein
MIEMTVSGQIWAKEGIPFTGDFGEVAKVLEFGKKAIKKKPRNNQF